MTRIAIFKPGKHAPEVTAADMQRAAEAYDPKKQAAPVVIGHPASNKPAWGWIKKLDFTNGKLYATLEKVHKGFASAVRSGRYPKMSASFYRPNAAGNPAPGGISIRHLGFLGAGIPAVPGLPVANFAAEDKDEDALSFESRVDADEFSVAADGEIDLAESLADMDERNADEFEQLKNRLDQLEARKTMNKDEKNNPAGDADKVNFAQREEQLKKDQAEFQKRVDEFEKREAEQARKGIADFVEEHHKAGKVLPRHKEGWIELMCALDGEQTINFVSADSKSGKAEKATLLEFVQDVLASLPQQINYEEIARPERAAPARAANFKTPDGYQVGGPNIDLAQKIEALMAQDSNLTYEQALGKLEQH